MAAVDIPQSLPDLRAEQLKNRFSALTSEQLTGLRLSYRYRLLQTGVRSNGWINLILGGFTIFSALSQSNRSGLNTFVAVVGAVIVLVSLWSIASPTPIGSAIWATVFGFAALWNFYVFFIGHNVLWGALGLFQLWWAYKGFRLYSKTAKIVWPAPETLRLYDELQRAMQRYERTNEDDPNYIQLRYQRLIWQGFLLDDKVVLASKRGMALLLAERSKTAFTFVDAKNPTSQQLMGAFSLDGITGANVTFPRLTFERYNRWRTLSIPKREELPAVSV